MSAPTFLAPAPVVAPALDDDQAQLAAALAVAEAEVATPVGAATSTARKTRVLIESPLAAKAESGRALNQIYGRAALRDSLLRGEAPMASHMLYAQTFVLDDTVQDEREIGMLAGFSWLPFVEKTVVYVDRGISPGMAEGIRRARELGVPVEERSIPEWARA